MSTIKVNRIENTATTDGGIDIDSSGRLLLGTTTEGAALADNLTVADSGHSGITIRSGTSSLGSLYFSDGTSGAAEYAGFVEYNHNGNYLGFGTGSTSRLRIDSSGNCGIGTSSPQSSLSVAGSIPNAPSTEGVHLGLTSNYAVMQLSGNTGGFIDFAEAGVDNAGRIIYTHSTDAMQFSTAASTKMTIDSSGNVGIGTSSFTATSSGRQILEINGTSSSLINLDVGGTRKAYHSTDGTDIYSYNTVNGSYIFGTNNSEKMRLDSSGNLGIGRTPVGGALGFPLQIRGTSFQSYIQFSTATQGDTLSDGFVVGSDNTNASIVQRENAHIMFATNDLERMRISSGGNCLIGRTSDSESANVGGVRIAANGTSYFYTEGRATLSIARQVNNGTAVEFRRGSGTPVVGTISVTTSGTSYNTSSDYRLKENVVDIADGITRVKQLSPRRFNFIADDTTTVDGFLAHEAQTVVPEAVTGEKDGEEMQGIDQSKLVPLLTAALQEAISKIETLETQHASLLARVTALEAA